MLYRMIILIFSMAFILYSQNANHDEQKNIIGLWHGHSICVDRNMDTACKDEEVVYECTGGVASFDSVRLKASKYIWRSLEPMGEIDLTYNPSVKNWTAEYHTRLKIRWSFTVRDSIMNGTLTELPSMRLIRTVQVTKFSTIE